MLGALVLDKAAAAGLWKTGAHIRIRAWALKRKRLTKKGLWIILKRVAIM
jgi:hypothetical protein